MREVRRIVFMERNAMTARILDVTPKNWAVISLTACLSISYLLPFNFFPFFSFYNDLLVIFGVAIAVALIGKGKITSVHIPWIAGLPLGLAAVIVLQAVSGMLTVNWDAVFPVAYFIVATIAVVLGASIAAGNNGSSRLCTALAYAYLFAGMISVVLATAQFRGVEEALMPFVMLMIHSPNSIVRPFANIAQPNHLALILCIAMVSVWWLHQVDRLRTMVAIGAVLSLLWGLALTQSRIGWIIVPAFSVLFLLWRGKPGFRRVSGWAIAGFVLIYAILVIALPFISLSLLSVSSASADQRIGTHTGSERLVLFQQALQISLSNPWFGAGWYEFGTQQLKIGSDFAPSIYSDHAHNIVLNFAAELGWPVTIIVFGAIAYWFYAGFFRRTISKEAGFAIFFFTAVSVHSLVEYPLWYAYFLLPTAFLIGMVHQERLGAKEIRLPRLYLIALFLLMTFGMVSVAQDYRRVVKGVWAGEMGVRGFAFSDFSTEKPAFTLFPHYYDYIRFSRIDIRPGMPPEEIAFGERVAQRFASFPILANMSLIYALNDRPDNALKTLLTIKSLHRCNYSEIYSHWEKNSSTMPEKFTKIFMRLPKPNRNEC
ncbi:MAG TPA: Wzy polymerase domain-containing protein [Burkholderiaceae bacterium]|jgi:O-antigen ligase|nr:Wzy polymerase domain-containing protein [Burkholderiaceae bacterium]